MLPGDFLFCRGKDGIRVPTEKESKSLFSHILMAWLEGLKMCWLTLKAMINKDMCVGQLSDYIGNYAGNIVLARRPFLTQANITSEVKCGLGAAGLWLQLAMRSDVRSAQIGEAVFCCQSEKETVLRRTAAGDESSIANSDCDGRSDHGDAGTDLGRCERRASVRFTER